MLRIGEQLAIVRGDNLHLATIIGLQLNDVDHESVLLTAGTELGIKIDYKAVEGAAIHTLRDQQIAPYQLLQIFEQRRDDIIGLLTDQFENLGFVTDYGADVEIDSIENVELDKPRVTGIEAHTAMLAVTAHITFLATATYEDPSTGIYDAEDKSVYFMETNTEMALRTVRIPFEVLVDQIAARNSQTGMQIQGRHCSEVLHLGSWRALLRAIHEHSESA